ncbi:MAG: M23 family metallopeptidase [Acidobacteriota bacterium]
MRYLFLTRRQVSRVVVGVAAWVLLVGFSLAVAPSVLMDWMARHRYVDATTEHQRLGGRLDGLVAELADLQTATDEVRIQMSKIHLVYGFTSDQAHGQGGYPHEPSPVPESEFAPAIRQANGHLARIAEQFGVLEAFLDEVQVFERDHQDQVRHTPSMSPVESERFVLTSPFGMRVSPFTGEEDFHAGIDFAAAVGTPIYAPAAGVVTFAGRYSLRRSVGWWRYGNLVAIQHGDRFVTLYGHCDEVTVRQGQTVEQGDLIATVGNTGWSTNPHLHYEIRRLEDDGSSRPVDPRIYILDHRWRNEERVLIRARRAPDTSEYEPLPRGLGR